MDLAQVWPLRGIRLTTPDLELRPATEEDLPTLVEILPDDLELDPSATRYAGLDELANRRAILVQGYWRAMGGWSPGEWVLPFVVRREGVPVGMQALEGPDYTRDRTVDSWSWLRASARGLGLGKQMRTAVLELAFGHLGAAAAVSSAVVDNTSSLGVSRSLGYRDTHTSVLDHSGETLQHLRLERSNWLASGLGRAIEVSGARVALPFFGLRDERA